MTSALLSKIYSNPLYLEYLRYHPNWYVILNNDENMYKEFEKEIKVAYKITAYDRIESLKKQVDFVNGMLKYFNS